MVKQRFRVLFRRWLFTVSEGRADQSCCFELFVLVRQYFQYVPLEHFGFADGSTFGFPAHGSVVLAVGVGRVVCGSNCAGFAVSVSELRQCSRSYWNPEAVRTNKA